MNQVSRSVFAREYPVNCREVSSIITVSTDSFTVIAITDSRTFLSACSMVYTAQQTKTEGKIIRSVGRKQEVNARIIVNNGLFCKQITNCGGGHLIP